jgi:hypothetical protein
MRGQIYPLRCILLTPMETKMSGIDRDRNRRISAPSEADFIHGFAHGNTRGHTESVILTALWALGLGKRRGR